MDQFLSWLCSLTFFKSNFYRVCSCHLVDCPELFSASCCSFSQGNMVIFIAFALCQVAWVLTKNEHRGCWLTSSPTCSAVLSWCSAARPCSAVFSRARCSASQPSAGARPSVCSAVCSAVLSCSAQPALRSPRESDVCIFTCLSLSCVARLGLSCRFPVQAVALRCSRVR